MTARHVASVDALLRELRASEAIGELDAQFAAFICRNAMQATEPLALAAALTSHATSEGHVCIDLARVAGKAVGESTVQAPKLAAWRTELESSDAVGLPGEWKPLVLDGDRLYLRRYWQYECAVAEQLLARAAQRIDAVDLKAVRAALDRWFPASEHIDWQKLAAALVVTRPLTIISGGPGTGKTTTVMRALAVLAETPTKPLRIALTAPTGKAAARLQEALRHARAALALPAHIDAQLPQEASTLHRLLGTVPGSTRFRHDRTRPLPLDVLVVDEASMIDLALMAKLLDALPPHARLIVLGDKDQLASVEAGAVMHSMCAGPDAYTSETAALLRKLTGYEVPAAEVISPLADAVAMLRQRYRFASGSAIAALADAAREGDVATALRVLGESDGTEVAWHAASEYAAVVAALTDRYEPLVRAAHRADATPEALYALLREHGVLCAHRAGPYGAETLNRAVELELRRRGLIDEPGTWYRGRPVMIRRNDYAARLYNGDVGVVCAGADGRLGVYFPDAAGRLRRYATARISASCESAFAVTVHKAQGSEYGAVDFVLPAQSSKILTRELFYTAVTRASARVAVWGSADIVRASLTGSVTRDSALANRLWFKPEANTPVQGTLF